LKRNEERKEKKKKKKGECHENFAVTRLTIKIIYQAAIAPQQKLPKQKTPEIIADLIKINPNLTHPKPTTLTENNTKIISVSQAI
jgi:hypothetical protein